MSKRDKVFAAIIALQVLILIFLPWRQHLANLWGHEAQLRVRMVDPPTVLSGYYVRLGYEISDPMDVTPTGAAVEAAELISFDSLAEGTEIYTVITPDFDGVSSAVRMALGPPELRANERVIHGVKKGGQVDYNIGQYFIPETSCDAVAQGLRDETADRRVTVRLDKHGNASLRGLRIGDVDY